MLLNVHLFVYVQLLANTYIRIFAHVVAWIFTYVHIFPLSVVGKGRGNFLIKIMTVSCQGFCGEVLMGR